MSDITEQEQTVEALRQSQERLARAQQIGHLGHWDWDIQRQTLMWSDEVYRIFGIDRTFPLTYETIEAMIHPDDRSRNSRYIQELLAAGDKIEFEFRIIQPNGGIRHIRQIALAARDEAGRPTRVFGIMQDITERKRAEEALRESEIKFHSIVEQSADGIVMADEQGIIIEWNPGQERLTGITRAEALGRPVWDMLYQALSEEQRIPATYERLRASALELLRTGQTPWLNQIQEMEIQRPDRTRRSVQAVMFTINTDKGFQSVSISRDITRRKQTEEQIRFLSAIAEQTTDAIIVTDTDYRIIYANEAAQRLFGYTMEELVGQKPDIFNAEAEVQSIQERIYTTVAFGNSHLETCLNRRKDGSTFLCEFKVTPMWGADGRICAYIGVQHDITERIQAEEALKQSREQLRALASHLHTTQEKERARVAREVHDEFGQSLTALKIDLAWLAKRLPPDEPVLANKVEDMIALIDNTIQIVRRVATELRPGLLDDLGLVAALEWQAQEFARRTGIACQVDLGQEALAQALLTLDQDLATAIFRIFQEAMTNVARHAAATHVQVALQQVQDVLILTVRDNGKGLSEIAASPRSLGLLGMQERALFWEGSVTFESEPGQGTAVTLRVPYLTGKEASR